MSIFPHCCHLLARNLWHSGIFVKNLKSLRNRFVMLQYSVAFRFQKYVPLGLFSLPIFTLYFWRKVTLRICKNQISNWASGCFFFFSCFWHWLWSNTLRMKLLSYIWIYVKPYGREGRWGSLILKGRDAWTQDEMESSPDVTSNPRSFTNLWDKKVENPHLIQK